MQQFRQLLLLTWLASLANSQQRGLVNPENHPSLTTYKCTKSGGCVVQNNKIVLDANYRWLHGALSGSSYPQCYSSDTWNSQLCSDPTTCAQNCYYDGANYAQYGITTSGSNLTILAYPQTGGPGSRMYLLAPNSDQNYQLFNLKNQEISFDVDVSGLPCAINGALYLAGMAADGGQSAFPNNKAGAYMGTGYCDAQCPRNIQFISGQANSLGWTSSTHQGRYGSCCHEMDVWESNSVSNQFAAHPCSTLGPYRCDGSGTDCNACAHDGCDINPYRLGNTNFYGPSGTVSTGPGKIRVITQFITSDGTATGKLTEVRRSYIRGGVTYNSPSSKIAGISGSSLTDSFCSQENSAFGGSGDYAAKGGMQSMDSAFNAGMVLVLSLWTDPSKNMLWLDSSYPAGSTSPGAVRGTCPATAYNDGALRSQYPNAQVQFSNIRYGDIGTTFGPPYP